MNPMKVAGFFVCTGMAVVCLVTGMPAAGHPYIAAAIVIASTGFDK